MKSSKLLILLLGLFLLPSWSFSAIPEITIPSIGQVSHPLYGGLTVGYGTTTWDGLIADDKDEYLAMAVSTPIDVNEGGTIGGAFIGYEVFQSFALEFSYTHYSSARLYFDEMSLVTYEYGGITTFVTQTNNYALVGKFMVTVPHTKNVRIFSSVGPSVTHRQDIVYDHWQLTPTFNFGFDMDITEHIILEVGANYTAGTGISELDPVEDYIPFLYSGFTRFAWRF
jgi:hypothetical protein